MIGARVSCPHTTNPGASDTAMSKVELCWTNNSGEGLSQAAPETLHLTKH